MRSTATVCLLLLSYRVVMGEISRETDLDDFDFTCWYISFRRVYESLAGSDLARALSEAERNAQPWVLPVRAKQAALKLMKAAKPRGLTDLVFHGEAVPGTFFTHHGLFRFQWPRREHDSAVVATARANLDWLTPPVALRMSFSSSDLTSGSARGYLSRSSRQLLFGVIQETSETEILAIPYAIGSPTSNLNWFGETPRWDRYNEVWIDEIDSFAAVKGMRPPSTADACELKNISELAIKQAFQEIIGEPFAEKDWGGEHSDLDTTQLIWNGTRQAAVFAFKGPSKFGVLHPGDMGKNGDQIDRLFHLNADLYVIQHCHKFAASVRNMMRMYATTPPGRNFVIIDGADTYRTLRAYGKCGFRAPRRRRDRNL
jgi:hypothetical protein